MDNSFNPQQYMNPSAQQEQEPKEKVKKAHPFRKGLLIGIFTTLAAVFIFCFVFLLLLVHFQRIHF